METTEQSGVDESIVIMKRRCLVAILIISALFDFLVGVLPEDSGFLLFF